MLYELDPATRDFFARFSIDVDALIEHAPRVQDGECLALMGSIVEGLANAESDIDLLYLGEGRLKDKITVSLQGDMTLGVSHDRNGFEINVEKLDNRQLESLAAGIHGSFQMLRDPRDAKELSIERSPARLRMVHRIRNATPLINGDVLRAWQDRLCVSQFHELVCHLNVEAMMNLEEDILGELQDGHFESARWMAKTCYAPKLAAAMLASVGETNQHGKWHHRLLQRRRHDLGEAQVVALLRFMTQAGPDSGPALLDELVAISQPAIQAIFERQRSVRRAALAFSLTARYNSFSAPSRWSRTEAAAAP